MESIIRVLFGIFLMAVLWLATLSCSSRPVAGLVLTGATPVPAPPVAPPPAGAPSTPAAAALASPPATGLSTLSSPGLVFSQAGTLPIIITAPHGGAEKVPNVRARTAPGAITRRDMWTDEITEAVANSLQGLLAGRPYVVIARFHRKYIDANREEALAFEDPNARAYYLAYHDAIRRYVDEVKGRYPGGALLIDIHGQAKSGFTDKVCRGTRNLRTVAALIRRHGPEALVGGDSIMGRLEKSGYTVFPPNSLPRNGDENEGHIGEYTVMVYGSHNPRGIDAIQLDIGSELRQSGVRPKFSAALAEAIAVFYQEYLVG